MDNYIIFVLGFVIATGLLHAAGIALSQVRCLAGGDAIVRGGGVIAALGAWFLLRAA